MIFRKIFFQTIMDISEVTKLVEELRIPNSDRTRFDAIRQQKQKEQDEIKTEFKAACVWYTELLLSSIAKAIPDIEGRGKAWLEADHFCWNHFETTKKSRVYPFHIIHYGFHSRGFSGKKFSNWLSRDKNTWKNMGVDHPFRVLQEVFYQKGYELTDHSDAPSNDGKTRPNFKLRIRLLNGDTIDHVTDCWHGLDVLPKDLLETDPLKSEQTDLTTDSDLPVFTGKIVCDCDDHNHHHV